ncbi:MAG: biotin--[acetyl-CoA-carboxylase] ligase [Caldilineales bacterium]|nr:biotin--[acetyl-CoA-carboxylase] ligase [Caldilineales bacterium]
MNAESEITLIRLHRVGSTQDWLRVWAELGAKDGLAVQAAAQTTGRGRLRREWQSPPGAGLYISVLLRPSIPLSQAQQATMLVSLAAIEACESIVGIKPQPKWPNDLICEGRKLAGVLTELESRDGEMRYAIVGLGLNVSGNFSGGDLAGKAASLEGISGKRVEVDAVAAAYLRALASRYARFHAGESPLAAWRERLWPLGQRVCVRGGGAEIVGLAEDVNPQGALLVRDDAGVQHTVWAGDIALCPQSE